MPFYLPVRDLQPSLSLSRDVNLCTQEKERKVNGGFCLEEAQLVLVQQISKKKNHSL